LFEHVTTLTHSTLGITLNETGWQASAGMSDQICTVQTQGEWAGVVADYDFTDSAEDVQDEFDQTILVRSADSLHLINHEAMSLQPEIPVTDVVAARLFSEGVAVLHQPASSDCQVTWHTPSGERSVSLDGQLCSSDAGVAVHPEDGTLWVANGTVTMIDDDGAHDLSVSGDLVDMDPSGDTIYVGDSNEDVIYGLDTDGSVSWSEDAEDELLSVESMGDLGMVVVGLATDAGGHISVFDGGMGTYVDGIPVPQGGEVISSGDGSTVAVVLNTEVHFFIVTPDGSRVVYLTPKEDEPVRFID